MKWHVASLKTAVAPGSQESSAEYQALLTQVRSRGLNFTHVDTIKHFPSFSAFAVRTGDEVGQEIADFPGVAHWVTPTPIDNSPDGRWYVNLLAAWEYVIRSSEPFAAACVNMSLRPPDSESRVFDPDEPLNRATRAAWSCGVIPIVAVGNNGELGDETMTRWSSAEWVIGVGAAEKNGVSVRSYSSKGSRSDPTIRPTVVAYDGAEPSRQGTSYATPQVTDIVQYLQGFFVALLSVTGSFSRLHRSHFPMIIRHALAAMARPVNAEPHECGAGFVSTEFLKQWLQSLTVSQLSTILDPVFEAESVSSWGQNLLIIKEALVRDALDSLICGARIARFTIDTTYEWTRPAFVPGLLRMDGYFLVRERDQFSHTPDFDIAQLDLSSEHVEQIAIVPKAQRGKTLRVGPDMEFTSIRSAIAAAGAWDVVSIAPGHYSESLTLKSGITLQGSDGTRIVQSKGTIVAIDDAVDVKLANLEIFTADRCDAVRISNSEDVIIESCRVTSEWGNAVGIYQSQRCLLRETTLDGGINGACLLFASQWTFAHVQSSGSQAGILIFGPGGGVDRSTIDSRWGDGIVWIYRLIRWTRWDPAMIHTYPSGAYMIPASAVRSSAIYQSDLVGWLSAKFCALQIEASEISGRRSGIAANALTLINARSTTVSKEMHVSLRKERPLDLRDANPRKVQKRIGRQLKSVTYSDVNDLPLAPEGQLNDSALPQGRESAVVTDVGLEFALRYFQRKFAASSSRALILDGNPEPIAKQIAATKSRKNKLYVR
jgi:subtilase family protein